MKTIGLTICGMLAATMSAQTTFTVSGTQIPADLVKVNYGKVPSTIEAFDLNICNQTGDKHSVTASQIYQALAASNTGLQPLGRQIMLAIMLRNQQRSAPTVVRVMLNSSVGVLSVLGAARTGVPGNVLAGAALGAAVGSQLLSSLTPILTADQVERYENQVLEPALVLDGGSCVERTVFTLASAGSKNKFENLIFHIR